MLTSEKLLKIISVLIFVSTILFAIVTVVKEIIRPVERFDRIVDEFCSDGYAEPEKTPENEQELETINNECVFIPSAKLNATDFLKSISKMGNIKDLDYLFIGSKGILLKKKHEDYSKAAQFIIKCIRQNDCSSDNEKDKFTLTLLLKDNSGKITASVSYTDTELMQIAKNTSKLFTDITKLKNADINKLRLLAYFHSNYTFIENKTPDYVVSLMKKGLDGLFLESRGAKIRVLPDEYHGIDPFVLLDRKGKQYGLEKNEYKKEEASVFIYRTAQFIEYNGGMIPFFISSKPEKSEYSDRISALFISKYLRNIQENSGRFLNGTEIYTGKEIDEKDSVTSQAYAAMALFRLAGKVDDQSITDTAEKSFSYINGLENKTEETKAFLVLISGICGEKCKISDEYSKQLENLKRISELVLKEPLSVGVFINAALTVKNDPDFLNGLTEILKSLAPEFEKMNSEKKVRYIASISEIAASENSALSLYVREFIEKNSDFLKSLIFDNRNFDDMKGGITLKKDADRPETALSIVLANGLSGASMNDTFSSVSYDISGKAGSYIKYLIVTDDDFPVWGSPSSKRKIQGGVRAFPGSSKIRLFNTARALNYFSNRILMESR